MKFTLSPEKKKAWSKYERPLEIIIGCVFGLPFFLFGLFAVYGLIALPLYKGQPVFLHEIPFSLGPIFIGACFMAIGFSRGRRKSVHALTQFNTFFWLCAYTVTTHFKFWLEGEFPLDGTAFVAVSALLALHYLRAAYKHLAKERSQGLEPLHVSVGVDRK